MRKFCLIKSIIIQTEKLVKCLRTASLGTKIPHTTLVFDLLATQIKMTFLTLTMYTLMPHKSWTRMSLGILDSHTKIALLKTSPLKT